MIDIYEGKKGQPVVDSGWRLENELGLAVLVGQHEEDFRGIKWVIVGGYAPRRIASSGRVYVRQLTKAGRVKAGEQALGVSGEQQFFPSIFGMVWRKV